MFIPDPGPDFYPSRIPDPKTATKERGGVFCGHKFRKIEFFFFKLLFYGKNLP
jgi:hypothetical protein